MLAVGGDDGIIRLYRASDGRLLSAPSKGTWAGLEPRLRCRGKHARERELGPEVKLWEAESGRLIRTLEGHLGPVHAVCFAPKGRYLVAAGAAGRLQFWELERGETFICLYAFGPGAWLALLPDGRFDGTPEALRYLCYTERDTLNSFTVEELVREFHAPQAVQEVLDKYPASRFREGLAMVKRRKPSGLSTY